jgi:predicted nucleic acid-binding protein
VIVIDASVAVKLYLDEPGAEQAIGLIQSNAGRISVPDVFVIEVASTLVRQANMGRQIAEISRDCLANFVRFVGGNAIQCVRPNGTDIATAGDIAIDIGHPMRDCLYLLLAIQLGCPLVTFDAKFAAKAKPYHAEIQLLAA